MGKIFLIGRIIYGGFFVFNGINHFLRLEMMSGYTASKGVPLPTAFVIITGIMILMGGASIITGIYPRIGVILLVLFLLPVSIIMHNFWAIEDLMTKSIDMVNFLKNFSLAGAALMMLAIPTPWIMSFKIGWFKSS